MENLPFEVVEKIFDLLRLKQKIKLRSVGPDWKTMTEDHLKHVKCIKCHPDLSCRFGCKAIREEICPEISDPEIFCKIMDLCPNLDQLCLIPSSVNSFRAPAGSGDCGASAWKGLIATGLAGVKCLSWDGLELDRPLQAKSLKHLSCQRITAAALSPVISQLEGLFYSHLMDFNEWQRLPHGMKFLRTGREGKFIPILSSPAAATLVDLEVACPIPADGELSFTPCFPNLEKFTYYSNATAIHPAQMDVMRKIFDASPKLSKLKLEILFDDDQYFLDYLPKFFACLKRMEISLFMVTLRKEHSIAESLYTMVLNTPLMTEATIRIPDMSDEELLTMTQWSKLKTLRLYSSKPAFRGTAFSIFVELMFNQSLEELITSNVVFTKSEQEQLLQTSIKFNLFAKYEDDWKKPVLRTFDQAFDTEKKFVRMIFTRKQQKAKFCVPNDLGEHFMKQKKF